MRSDLPEVLSIEHRGTSDPWNQNDLERSIRQRNCIGMVAEIGEKVVGHMIYELYEDHLHLLRLEVVPEFRNQGIEKQMLVKLMDKLLSHRRTHIIFDVNESPFGKTCVLARLRLQGRPG